MAIQIHNTKRLEKIIAIIFLIAVFAFIPLKIIDKGFRPTDDVNRHVAFSVTEQKWTDVLVIEKGLEADHNVGWHKILRFLHKYIKLDKKELLVFSIVSLFLLVNLTGSLVSSNLSSWSIVLLIMIIFSKQVIARLMLGRPFIFSCFCALILFKLWFADSSKKWFAKYLFTIIVLTLAVWIHGTWYTFLLLPFALLISGKVTKSAELTLLIILSTILGALLTGDFKEFLYYHYAATLNIFTERLYTWQLVTEFAEGNYALLWLIPTVAITIISIYTKKIKLNDLSKDPLFILILLTWLLSIKVIRFWSDWGIIALMFWLSNQLSELIKDMQSIKKTFFRYVLFTFIMISLALLIPNLNWNNEKNGKYNQINFNQEQYASFLPEDGGIIYNDNMLHFYYLYYENPEAKYKYVLGFEPAIMSKDNKKIYREIAYSKCHYSAYKPWIEKLTEKDRIYTSKDISEFYPQLTWIKANKSLYIGKKR